MMSSTGVNGWSMSKLGKSIEEMARRAADLQISTLQILLLAKEMQRPDILYKLHTQLEASLSSWEITMSELALIRSMLTCAPADGLLQKTV